MSILKLYDGNRTLAAQLLGVDRKTLYRRLERYKASDAIERRGLMPNATGETVTPGIAAQAASNDDEECMASTADWSR
jgi:hypothetical protein